MSRNNDYTTGNLLDYEYFKDHYRLIAIDATVFFIIEKEEETTFDFSQNSLTVV